jgi:peroxiredoxin
LKLRVTPLSGRKLRRGNSDVPVPDFTFIDFNGGTRRLSDYRGRYVLLDFWGLCLRPARCHR